MVDKDDETLFQQLEDSVRDNPDDPSHHFNFAIFLWENREESKGKAAEHFLIAAKLNPHNGSAFRFLGHHYSKGSDAQPDRSIKCYQRALTLNPDDSESGEALCNMLDRGGKESLEVATCKDASERSPRAFWAFRRLGYLQVHQSRWSESVQSLQHAIRGYPSCADLWEALGLAYQRLGMFTAAIKSYARSIDLEDSRFFSLVESGNILLMLGFFRKAIEQFRHALEISPESVSARYGLASAMLGLSKECISLGMNGRGSTLLEEATEILEGSTSSNGNLSCLWKLHGDILYTYAKCTPWMEEEQSSEMNQEDFSRSIVLWKQTCCSAAISAQKSYQRALHLAPWQANNYVDISITSDLIYSLKEKLKADQHAWQLSEKMSLGGLLLEGDNREFWVALGCISGHSALSQHAFIRGLQLDISLAISWSYLGKLYRREGEKELAVKAFDSSRSFDPSLAIPWAGMSADSHIRRTSSSEAYESCLRAVQTFPYADFQVGFVKLALLTDNLSSAQVFGAIQQAVQRTPQYPESHNLKGLVYEARSDYMSAASSYRLARCAITVTAVSVAKSYLRDITTNLARALSKGGNALEAMQECELLKKEDLLDVESSQIYVLCLWELGKSDLALSEARNLASRVSTLDQETGGCTIAFICRLLYCISGLESATNSIVKMPKELFQTPNLSFVVSAAHALDRSGQLDFVVSVSRQCLTSYEEITGMHHLIALSKLVKNGSDQSLNVPSAVHHLRKVLHMYPNSSLLRSLLGYIILSDEGCKDLHVATRCCLTNTSEFDRKGGLKSACEILGSAEVACYAYRSSNINHSFATCRCQCLTGLRPIQLLQKWLHHQPWNRNARYLLALNLLQRARRDRFPQRLCISITRLLEPILSDPDVSDQYHKFQCLLCASEVSLQCGDHINSIKHAKDATALMVSKGCLFFAHLLLCRAYVVKNDPIRSLEEYMRCLELKTDHHIGWMCLKVMESKLVVENYTNILELRFSECLAESNSSQDMWMAIYYLVSGMIYFCYRNPVNALDFMDRACSLASAENFPSLCHGTHLCNGNDGGDIFAYFLSGVCLELARWQCDSQFLSLALKSLSNSQKSCVHPLPYAYLLLAQAVGSQGLKTKWNRNLRLEWFAWPPDARPAELLFQMHLVAKQSEGGAGSSSTSESSQRSLSLLLRAIHLNPSCFRYWNVLHKLME